MKRITVLGCGLVGGLIVRDLAADEELSIRVGDASEQALDRVRELPRVETRKADLSDPVSIRDLVSDADVVVGAVPGRIGFSMLKTVVESGKPIADISFSPEDPLQLDELAADRGATAIVDCGVSPGLSNLAVGRAASRLDQIEEAVIYVGGLPRERYWPWEYRIVFSATDVIEEYTRPARVIENGVLVTRPALSEIEPLEFAGIGTLEAFNTDGLRTLLSTVPARNMREKTLRYPGHAERMRMLRESGFFSEHPIEVGGTSVVPRQMTERLLFTQWIRPPHEDEFTVLRVTVRGSAAGRMTTFEYDLFDQTDRESGATSMARTTGFPCAIAARMLLDGSCCTPGIRPLEKLAGDDRFYQRMVGELRSRGVHFEERETSLSGEED
ncbi:MAG TPA: saccharopine dehydrogenase C-terminal domain-containing protein [Thermoanaerobaculia bacterium]|nr:saccharopine dehydrogenase C-terminal domain-containing protein [Thermoanaerobaculia bacterium]